MKKEYLSGFIVLMWFFELISQLVYNIRKLDVNLVVRRVKRPLYKYVVCDNNIHSCSICNRTYR